MDFLHIINEIAGLITSLGVLAAFLWTVHKYLQKPIDKDKDMESFKEETTREINNIKGELDGLKAEQNIQTQCLLAIMDGLKELGCNGNVTTTRQMLSDYLVKKAHE